MLASNFGSGKVEAGCDEAGRGPLAGPVVAAAVILPVDYKNELLNDSKQLKRSHREQLEQTIKKEALAWAVAEVSPEEIDEINILNASFLAMHRAIDQLKQVPELLLIDGNRFKKYKDIEHACVIKGDGKYMSIAAASILAKTHRDLIMSNAAQQYPGYGWESNAGYPTVKHRQAIKELGVTAPYTGSHSGFCPSKWSSSNQRWLPFTIRNINLIQKYKYEVLKGAVGSNISVTIGR